MFSHPLKVMQHHYNIKGIAAQDPLSNQQLSPICDAFVESDARETAASWQVATLNNAAQLGDASPLRLRLPAQTWFFDRPSCAETRVKTTNFAAVQPLLELSTRDTKAWKDFTASWNHLGLDPYHQGACRRRTFSTFSYDTEIGALTLNGHHPLFQPANINVLNGGLYREFQPVAPQIICDENFLSALNFGLTLATRLEQSAGRVTHWHIEAQQFRVVASNEFTGAPTPEGIHRDGRDYVSMMFIGGENIRGGKSHIYDDSSDQSIASLTLSTPSEVLFVADRKVRHSVSPITPSAGGACGYRDMLIFAYTNLAHPNSLGRWVVPSLVIDAQAA